VPYLLALGVLIAHARVLPPTLEDIDSINFAMGVESFDVASHRPHPPGYPVYIAAAKLSTAVAPIADRDRRAAVGLAVWSVVAAAAAVLIVSAFWTAVGWPPIVAWLAAMVGVASPLFWFTSARPLSDVPGLVMAIGAQGLILRGWGAARAGGPAPRALLWGAAIAGLAIGVRSQAVWINGPTLAWCVAAMAVRGRARDAVRLVAWAAAACLLWAIPLVWDSGGFAAYLRSLGSQGTQDFTGVRMLATSPSWDLFEFSMQRTFAEPWFERTFARLILLFAIVGLVHLATRRRAELALVLLTFLPYLVFHLVFQEVATLRYALPVVLGVAGCFVAGLWWIGTRVAVVVGAAAVIAGVAIAHPRLETFAADGAAVHRAFQDMIRARTAGGDEPVVRTHHQVWHGVQRLFDWYRPVWDVGPQPFPFDREWLEVVAHWRSGSTRPVWFLCDLTRHDVALFDSRSRRLAGRYETPREIRQAIGAETRLDGLNWWRLDRPSWMLGAGWSITPEVAGMTRLDGLGPEIRPVEAYLARTATPTRVLIGGRHLAANGPPARLTADLDGQRLREWTVTPAQPWFVEWIDLPGGVPAGAGAYATLSIQAASLEPGRAAPWVGLEQFDAAPADDVVFAFQPGWHELEHDPRTGRTWRWSASRSTIQVRGAPGDVRLTLAGESPLVYFDRAPTVTVLAGAREIARFRPSADFTETIVVPAAALAEANGEIAIATDLTFVPGDRENTPDRRTLGLRLYSVSVTR
jgi:hypothetical protein